MFFNLDLLVIQIKKVKNFRRSPFLAPRPCTATFLRLPSDSDPCSGLVSLRLFPKLTNRHSLLCLVAAFSHHQPVHFWSLTFKTSSTITTNPYTRHLGVHSVPKSFVHHLSAIPKSLFCLKTFVKRFGLLMGFVLSASRSHHLNTPLLCYIPELKGWPHGPTILTTVSSHQDLNTLSLIACACGTFK